MALPTIPTATQNIMDITSLQDHSDTLVILVAIALGKHKHKKRMIDQ